LLNTYKLVRSEDSLNPQLIYPILSSG
jgi:hypothetical protein